MIAQQWGAIFDSDTGWKAETDGKGYTIDIKGNIESKKLMLVHAGPALIGFWTNPEYHFYSGYDRFSLSSSRVSGCSFRWTTIGCL